MSDIANQAELIAKLQQEIEELKKELEEWKKKANSRVSTPKGPPPIRPLPIVIDKSLGKSNGAPVIDRRNSTPLPDTRKLNNSSDSTIETGATKQEAANALTALLFGKKSSPSLPKPEPIPQKTPNINLISELKTSSPPLPSSTNKLIFEKYEKMLKLGAQMNSAINRMIQDGIDRKIIDEFKNYHNVNSDQATVNETEKRFTPAELGLKPKLPIDTKCKMKRIHWDPVPIDKIKGTIWEELDDVNHLEDIKYDIDEFEREFQIRPPKPPLNNQVKQVSKPSSTSSKEKIQWISGKRSQQVQIGLKGLNLSNEQIRNAIISMDDKVLTLDKLSKLLDFAPTPEEQAESEKKSEEYHYSQFGVAESFFYSLCDLVDLRQRLEKWQFTMEFEETSNGLKDQYKMLQKTCLMIRNNKRFKKILKLILGFGNHMNSGTDKGQCYGFNIKALNMLSAIKSINNQKTLLMYVYEFCEDYDNDILQVIDDFATLRHTSTVETEVIAKLYERLSQNMQELNEMVQRWKEEYSELIPNDQFVPYMEQFLTKANPNMNKLKTAESTTQATITRLIKYYSYSIGERSEPIENLFKSVYEFIESLNKSKGELVKLEMERQKRIAKKKRESKKSKTPKDKSNNEITSAKDINDNNINSPSPPINTTSDVTITIPLKNTTDNKPKIKPGHKRSMTIKQSATALLIAGEERQEVAEKLSYHMRARSKFIQNGGDIDDPSKQNTTMQQISNEYKDVVVNENRNNLKIPPKMNKLPDLPNGAKKS